MLEAMVWAFDQRLGDAGAKFVLVTLADMANGDCVCWPSVNELAKRTDMGESTVRRHLKWLAQEGWVQRHSRWRPRGGRSSDIYVLAMPERDPVPRSATQEVRREWEAMRAKTASVIRKRDGNRCVRCHATRNLVTDHIVPIEADGTNDESNLQTLCAGCTGAKVKDDKAAIRAYRSNREGGHTAQIEQAYRSNRAGAPSKSSRDRTVTEASSVEPTPSSGDASPGVEKEKRSKQPPKKAKSSWSFEAAQLFQRHMDGVAPGGRIAKALCKLVDRHGEVEVLDQWDVYLWGMVTAGRAAFATAEDFAARYGYYKANGVKQPVRKDGQGQLTNEEERAHYALQRRDAERRQAAVEKPQEVQDWMAHHEDRAHEIYDEVAYSPEALELAIDQKPERVQAWIDRHVIAYIKREMAAA